MPVPWPKRLYPDARCIDEPDLEKTSVGAHFDSLAQFHFYRARYYHPQLGRFLSKDPELYMDGLNAYEYGRSNPPEYSDPSGTGFINCCKALEELAKAVARLVERTAEAVNPNAGHIRALKGAVQRVKNALGTVVNNCGAAAGAAALIAAAEAAIQAAEQIIQQWQQSGEPIPVPP